MQFTAMSPVHNSGSVTDTSPTPLTVMIPSLPWHSGLAQGRVIFVEWLKRKTELVGRLSHPPTQPQGAEPPNQI